MTTRITVEIQYVTYGNITLDLPDGKTWDDVDDWFIKWDVLHVIWKDDTAWLKDLNTNFSDGVDCKRPMATAISDAITERLLDEQ